MGSCLSADGGGSPRSGGGGGGGSPGATSPLLQSPGSRRGRRRKQGGAFSAEFEQQQMLHRVPGRMCVNGAGEVACLFTQQGKKGTNQDAMLVWENFASRRDAVFCGVFDGHGPYGHVVARKVRDSLPLKLSAHWEVNTGNNDSVSENSISLLGSLNPEDTLSVYLDGDSRDSVNLRDERVFSALKESFLKAYRVMDKELKLHPSIDCYCSGTTAVTLVKQGQDLVIGNVGDSRAVLGTRDDNDRLIGVQLTVDLKPNLPKEEERIKQCRGRVFALRDEPEVARVWLPHNDSPGLAMARAFGDFCLKDFGLISVPEVSYRRLTEKDEFIVLATDGVWDVLSNNEVVDIVASAPNRSSAAQVLVESAVRAWKYKYPTSKIDDCAVVCLFLSNSSDDAAAASGDSISSHRMSNMNNTKGSLSSSKVSGNPDSEENFSTPTGELDQHGNQVNAVLGSHHQTSADGETNSPMLADEWSTLEGVSRVNTLLTLPRFSAEKPPSGSKSKKFL